MRAARAAELIRAGGLVAFPTETVYGLGCDATNPHAVARLYAVKGRPRFNPLIVHLLGLEEARKHADLPPTGLKLAEAFWPGPLTIVAPRRAESAVAELACAGLATIALRAPSHPMARELLDAAALPLAAPSANRSGRLSPTTAAHVREEFGDDIDLILDGGACAHGVESTIIGFDAEGRARLLRSGAITREAIEAVVGPLMAAGEGVEAPGMLARHYAPKARLRLNATAPLPGEVHLSFGAPAQPGGATLSARGDLVEAAANLYATLRALDAAGAAAIAVAPIPNQGLGEAINDRLTRAAAPCEGQ
jgi:L-threonylcarbamoyladenylate synthase